MSACSVCGTLFACGMADADASHPCWCVALPALPLAFLEKDQTGKERLCLCPACLTQVIADTNEDTSDVR